MFLKGHQVIQTVLNGHEDSPLIPQPMQQQPHSQTAQHSYTPEKTTLEFSQSDLNISGGEQVPQVKDKEQVVNEELPVTDSFGSSNAETEQSHSLNTSNSANPSEIKTYATLVKSYSSTTCPTSPQVPKLSMSPVSFSFICEFSSFEKRGKFRIPSSTFKGI